MYDPEARRLIGTKGSQGVSPSEHRILARLMQWPGKCVSYDMMIGALWANPADEPEWPQMSVKVHVCRLRAKLRASGCGDQIGTVWGAGYLYISEKH